MIIADHRCYIGSWSGSGFETVLAANMTYASRMLEGHAGSFGKWSFSGGGGEDACIIMDIATTYPVYAYGMEYKGQGGMGATKLEYPKQIRMKICSAGPDRFSVIHPYGPDELTLIRTASFSHPDLAARVDELKSLLVIQEASAANNRATWNKQFGIFEDLQGDRWKQINSWKLS